VARLPTAFGALVLAQSAHSIEEYIGRLWETLPPAGTVSGLFSDNLERGFVMANVALVAFGVWCWIWPVRRGWRGAVRLAWVWVTIELINGVGHPLWQGGYIPGVATAPILLALALYLATQLRHGEIPSYIAACSRRPLGG
jgi:hypothetical protein